MEAAGRRWITHPSRSDVFRIWNLADLHLGNKGIARDKLKADIAEIQADPYSFWVGGGDYADYITTRDKRFDAETMDEEYLDLASIGCIGKTLTTAVRDLFKPIAHKCLGLCFGNHEGHYMKEEDQADLHAWLCNELGVPNLRYSALMDLVFVRAKCAKPQLTGKASTRGESTTQRLRVYVHHGAGAAVTNSGKANRLARFAQLTTADVVFVGHCHDAQILPLPILDANDDCSQIREKKRLALMTGSYLRTYASGQTGYGEVKGYAPSTLGAVWVSFKPETRQLESTIRA